MRAGAGATTTLALLLWGCGEPEPIIWCSLQPLPRVNVRVCVGHKAEGSYQSKEAHCFRNGPRMACTPTRAECLDWRRLEGRDGPCQLTEPGAVP